MFEDLLKTLKPPPPFSYCLICEEPFPINLSGESRFCSGTCLGMHQESTGGYLPPDYYDLTKDKDIASKTAQRQWIHNFFMENCKALNLPLEDYTPRQRQSFTEKLLEFKEKFGEIKAKINPPLSEEEEKTLIKFVDYLVSTQYWYDPL